LLNYLLNHRLKPKIVENHSKIVHRVRWLSWDLVVFAKLFKVIYFFHPFLIEFRL
jgi:hypothetical protein